MLSEAKQALLHRPTARRDVNIGVIGAGGRGSIADDTHQPADGVRLVAGADTDPDALAVFGEKFPGAFVTGDYHRLLARTEIDAVFVTSPDYLHEEHAVAALEAGKDVYLEKPMAITIEGCDRILHAAAIYGRKLYLGHNMRHFPVMQKMRQLIDDGAIGVVKTVWCRHFVSYGGDAFFKDWHADRTKSTGMLLQKGAHDIDMLHWFGGACTEIVTALGGLTLYDRITDRHDPAERGDASWHNSNWPPLTQKQLNPVIDVEDISMMLMRLTNGVFTSYQQCHFTPDSWRNYTIIGEAGRIENFGDRPGRATVRLWDKRRDGYAEPNHEFIIPPATGSHGGADPMIVEEFIRYLRDETEPAITPWDARQAVATGVKATESLRQGGQPMKIPSLAGDTADE